MHIRTGSAVQRVETYRPDIEGLRAVAVLSVVAFHFGLPLPGGFIGVDVFFVISGYLITRILLSEMDRTGSIDLMRFYGRRARRLLPASLLMIACTLAAGTLILAPIEQKFMAKGAFASGVYSSNLYFMLLRDDYFAKGSGLNPFLHTWSLAVEEQFYVVWPGLLLVASRYLKLPRPVWLAALCVLSVALCVWLTWYRQPFAFYSSPARAWEFGLGALATLPIVSKWAALSRSSVPLGWIGAAVLATCLLTFHEGIVFPGSIAALPASATALILLSGVSPSRGLRSLLTFPALQWVGKLSYSIYLWHWPVIVFATILYPERGPAVILACCAITLAASYASFRLVEDPVRNNPWLGARAVRSVALGALLTFVTAGSGGVAFLMARHFAAEPAQAKILAQATEMPAGSDRKCLINFTDAEPMPCVFGQETSSKTVVLIGDSHADQWSTPLSELATREGWKLVTYLKASCSVSDIPIYSKRLRRWSPECAEWRRRSIEEIAKLNPALIVVSQFSNGYIKGPRSGLGEYAVSYDEWETGLTKSLQVLASSGPVLLLRDTPTPSVDLATCVERSAWRGLSSDTCMVTRSAAIDERLTALERNVAQSSGVSFADMTNTFCDQSCPGMKDGMLVYRDANHLATPYARRLAPLIKAYLPEHL
ncbi:MAG: acyltransferase [Mesorhizobium sp.]|uniref:acyltransferase family protein n=1 Tax=unclassified Mesorhizobium TaxID=325217 RepID=UPI000FCBFD37|nr:MULTISPECIES: acyltransferase family protein [unclassified Mesorhizobium]RUV70663.1 acyltransferase [Mesorhizobium sp. M5C.F.Cr.IN.023.01.1.1]RWI51037.1 MAG: acyltransferase [Mesorhizobium sp.]RWI62025.1 MAG: acyltransferase [Mesorhizobium sp.]RWJ13874.1 MAG: acyltransferase [Mesorhizobium sp.]RWJ16899.1 MAG: acyltransferase [Mesorhizobium sp.]